MGLRPVVFLALAGWAAADRAAASWRGSEGAGQGEALSPDGLGGRAVLVAAQGAGHPVKMDKAVEALTEAARRVDDERSAGQVLARERSKDCTAARAAFQKAKRGNSRTASEAREGLQVAVAAVKGLEAEIKGLRAQLADAGDEISNVTGRLRSLRATRAQMQGRSQKSLQQLRAVVATAYLRGKGEDRRLGLPERLRLAAAHALEPPAPTKELPSATSLVERGSHGASHGAGAGAAGVLDADGQELVEARADAARGFDEEEAKLTGMLKLLRKRVKDLQADLAERQPSFADRIRQLAEINSTVVVAERAGARDDQMMMSLKKKCDLMADASERLDKLRLQASDLIRMPAGLLKRMGTTTLLAGDLQSLGSALPQLLQLAMGEDRLGRRGHTEPPRGMPGGPTASGSAPAAADLALVAVEGRSGDGPFDGVERTIRNLLASLRDEANQDVSRQQWCADSQAQNLKERLAATDRLDALATQARWAKAALARLAAETSFSEGELSRLRKAAADAQGELDKELARVEALVGEHGRVRELVSRTLDVVRKLCDLSSAALLQGRAPAGPGGCADAAQLMQKALAKLDELSSATSAYGKSFRGLSVGFTDKVEKAAQQQESDLIAAKTASAKRANELATAEEEMKQQEKSVRLLTTTKAQLEKSCGPKAETAQDRLQRRAEELDALKGALAVLEGQAVPV